MGGVCATLFFEVIGFFPFFSLGIIDGFLICGGNERETTAKVVFFREFQNQSRRAEESLCFWAGIFLPVGSVTSWTDDVVWYTSGSFVIHDCFGMDYA